MASLSSGTAGQKVANYHAPPLYTPWPRAKGSGSSSHADGTHIHVLRCLDSRIHLGFHLFPHIVRTLLVGLDSEDGSQIQPSTTSASSTFVLITDTNIAALFLADLEKEFRRGVADFFPTGSPRAPPRLLTYVIPPGERSKGRETKAAIEDWMLGHKVTRDATVIALGGGVIGDLVGFVAATFMRGVKFVQIPTTLLAMVDSSVGGKTAIDTPAGKNLIGSFHQPQYIFIDAALLETLPEREFANGMAEVVKTAAIWDADDFDKLEARATEIRAAAMDTPQRRAKLGQGQQAAPPATAQGRTLHDRSLPQTLLLDVIRGSVGVKAHIVTIDEKETGLRNLVNFGHSVGHAIEAVLTPDILHGECVSIGMILEAEISRRMHGLSQVVIGRLTRCLKEYGLPVSVEDPRIRKVVDSSPTRALTVDRLLDIMRVDKKNSGSDKKIVLLSKVGGTVEDKASTVSDDIIRRVLAQAARVIPLGSPHALPQPQVVCLSTPGSKSISNRALVLAALANGTCALRNLLHSDDTQVMMAGLKDLQAASFDWADGGETIIVHGNGGLLKRPAGGKEIYLQNAGTAARFMATVCTLVRDSDEASPVVITGNKRMKERPIGPLVDALTSNGSQITYKESTGCLPLAISSGGAGLRGGNIQLSASISSQYVSSILLCAPYAEQEVLLELVGGQVISQLYIDMTIAMMASFGIVVERLVDPATGKLLDAYRIPKGHYVAPAQYDIESDASSATYPLAIAAITGTTCTVENIGKDSLQGDARFAKEVLEPMGCTVVQTRTSTKVTGPPVGQLRHIGVVDMEPMTDAFLTASVLLAVAAKPSADGRTSTQITGIANQRVKECNRIKAMMDELAKFGVQTKEHEDGLEIFGVALSHVHADVSVHCYDDHRVAMAFSVLATIAPGQGTILEEKRCVEKTWPNWWDDLERKLGFKVEGVELAASVGPSRTHPFLTKLNRHLTPLAYPEDATVFFIGMRGTGKTYLGRHAAEALGRPFLDADHIFDERYHLKGFVAQHGWPAFRKAETDILKELMGERSRGYLISLGGGVVESEENQQLLRDYATSRGPVVYVKRDIDEIVAFLETSDRPAYGESVRDVWTRRQPRFYDCSSCELVNYTASVKALTNGSDASHVPEHAVSIRRTPTLLGEVRRFSRFIAGLGPDPTSEKAFSNGWTSMLSLTFPDIRQALPLLEKLTVGTDAVELRVDLLSPSGTPLRAPAVPPAEYVSRQLAALRSRSDLPVIYTIRTASQGGMFPDEEVEAYFHLIQLGLRSGCEYVDLEVRWPLERLRAVTASKGRSQIIASWHDTPGNLKWTSKEAEEKYQELAEHGDIVKIVGRADTMSDNIDLEVFRQQHSAAGSKPLLAVNRGAAGQLSRVLNRVFTPITHALMPFKAAPGQLTAYEVNIARGLNGLVEAKQFALFGTPISHSLSPTIHNTGFATTGLPHKYVLHETPTVDDSIRELIRRPDFGGASVTIPHKLAIMSELDIVTPHATLIGAVNTIIPIEVDGQRKLVGDNTDWVAIKALTQRKLPSVYESRVDTALIIGAGGSARAAIYAMHKLGAKRIWLFNRTPANAVLLAQSIPAEWNVVVTESIDRLDPLPSVIISNVPAEGTALQGASEGVILPEAILDIPTGGVAIDMSYKPSHTPLLQLVEQVNGTRSVASLQEVGDHIVAAGRWTSIPGLVILLEQGCEQFERWTGVHAPRYEIEEAAWQRYNL